VCGAELKVEGSQGRGDDTAANVVRVTYCKLGNWSSQVPVEIHPGFWGLGEACACAPIIIMWMEHK